MQEGLLRSLFWIVALSTTALCLRELVAGGPIVSVATSAVLGLGALFWSFRPGAPLRQIGLGILVAMTVLIAKAAYDLGGAAGPALCLSFLPGFVAVLVLGPALGWFVTALSLLSLLTLFIIAPPTAKYDLLRFTDEVAMVPFTAGLAHALMRSLSAYEGVIRERGAALRRMSERLKQMTATIYQRLDPLAAKLVSDLDAPPGSQAQGELDATLEELLENLSRTRALAENAPMEGATSPGLNLSIRRDAVRLWLRLAMLLMALFALRNFLADAPYLASILALACCVLVDYWCGRISSVSGLEWAGLFVGIIATGPMVLHLQGYGMTPDAPPLVVMPGIVLFTALLSQGPSLLAVLALQLGILAWVAVGERLTVTQTRLLTDLVLSFVVLIHALRRVLALRSRYADELLEQDHSLTLALRQRRRLSGTLFHDARNHLQALLFHLDDSESKDQLTHARSLSRRIQRLIAVSKDLLLPTDGAAQLVPVSLASVVSALKEAYGPRLRAKDQELSVEETNALRVLAMPELLVESVLGNLLSNAIKFSPPGGLINLQAEKLGTQVRVTVSDSGPGIQEQVLSQLGGEGAVSSQRGTAGETGQGFGLQLAQEHLQRMGGRLELTQRNGGGTAASVWLSAG